MSTLQRSEVATRLSQVGMTKIEMPVLFQLEGAAAPLLLPAVIDAFVSLDDPHAKGIHMSRLYLELKNNLQVKTLSFALMKEILKNFLSSHEGLSESAYLEIAFQIPVERRALISGEPGYRQYPAVMKARSEKGVFECSLNTEVVYSSTCPCSAALARQLFSQAFEAEFQGSESIDKSDVAKWLAGKGSIVAYPHAQRSVAKFEIRLGDAAFTPSVIEVIDHAEKALGTPVQSAVKRADEQEFARLNAQNLMFCEDAARKLRSVLESDQRIVDYHIHVEHQESLHPHNAVSRVVKGVPGGFRA